MGDLKISIGQMQIDASRTVKRGDTLTRIAREEGVGLADLKKVNPDLCDVQKGRDRQCNLIFPGDEVILPPKANSVAKNSLEKPSASSPFQSFTRAMEYLGKARNAPASPHDHLGEGHCLGGDLSFGRGASTGGG